MTEEAQPNAEQVNAARDTRLIAALAKVSPHDHLCSIYESAEEHFAVAVPFIRIGLDRGEKCIYVADDGAETVVKAAMASDGIDVERAIATERLVVLPKEAAYLRHGIFDPASMLTFWADAAGDATRNGFPALRVTGETEWVLDGHPGVERWRDYEIRLSRMVAEHDCSVLCQYNRLICPPEIVLDVIRTHPTVVYRGAVCRNMYHVPPEELLGSAGPEHEVARLLSTLREREEVEFTLTQQRNELRESEARLREIAENIREVFWVWDVGADQVTFVSPTYEDVFGRSCASLYADFGTFLDTIHADDRERVESALERSRAGTPTDEQYRVVRPDGSMRWVRDRAFPVPTAGPVRRVVGIADDITERKNAEEELRQSEALLRLVVNALPVGVAVVDRSGDIILVNPASRRIWAGTVRSGAERQTASKAWRHDTGERIASNEWGSARALATGEISGKEILDIEAFDGVRKTIENSAVPIRDPSGTVTGAVVVNEDISATVAAQRALKDSYDQLRTLTGRLMRAQDDERRRIAQMLHETTAQDLAALKMLLARLNRTPAALDESERGILTESISLADQSMTEIRTLSYLLHPPFLDEMGLVSALRWYAAGFTKRSGIKVDLDLPESFVRPSRDTETALFRVVQEALINVHRHASSKTARILLRASDDGFVLQIDDDGHGIPSAALEHILAGRESAGVGIIGMSERIRQLGGRLDITSEGRGTTVRAVLPLAKREA
jgi:two-component system NarL family sensor kinase